MARGRANVVQNTGVSGLVQRAPTSDTPTKALEMTKWFDTNYHYLVPELEANQQFNLRSKKAVEEFLEAKALGIHTRPVIIGPVSFLKLAKMKDAHNNRWSLLSGLLQVYIELFDLLKTAGADWIQIDEPCLVLDIDAETKKLTKMLMMLCPSLDSDCY